MTTLVSTKPFVGAIAACAWCLEKDPLRLHPGRMRVTRAADALVLATATRTEKVKVQFRIPCPPGETWVAVVDAEGTSRLAKALRPLAAGKKNGNSTIEVERTERALVLVGGGQRISIPACEPMIEEPGPAPTEVLAVGGGKDLAARIAEAMTFCKPAEYRAIAKGPFVYFAAAKGGLSVPAVVATDGHRLFVDGDAHDCSDAKFVFQVPGDDWKPATKAVAGEFETVRLERSPVRQPVQEDGKKPEERWLVRLVFESPERRVEVSVDEPQTSLPRWASFMPRETADPDLSVTCNRDELAKAVKTMAGLSVENNSACMFRADPTTGVLHIAAYTDHDGGMAQQEIPAEIRHAPAGYVHLNGRYVLDVLGAVRTQRVRFWQDSAPLDSVRFSDVVADGTATRPRGMVIMPIRGNDPKEEVEQDGAGEAEGGQPAASSHAGETLPAAATAAG